MPGGYGYHGYYGRHGGYRRHGDLYSSGLWYKDVTSGFYAVAQVHNDNVTLHVSSQREALSSKGNGTINTGGHMNTVRGRLGEWLQLGGTSDYSKQHSTGTSRSTRPREDDKTLWWVKVDPMQ